MLLLILLFGCDKPKQKKDEHAGMNMMPDMVELSPHESAIINLAVDTAKIKTIFETSDFTGTVTIDENNISNISSRVNGRIEKLYVRNPGEEIKKGQLLYSVYSEELMSDENEFLLAINQQPEYTNQKNTVDALAEASHKKLLLWGLSETQITELTQNKKTSPTVNFYSNVNGYLSELNVSEGEYVSTGTPLFKIASLETVWVNAEIYQNELSYLFQNPEIELAFEALPNEIFKGQIILNPPELNANKKVSSVKISVQNTKGKIKPGMMAIVSVRRNQKKTLVILKSSIVLGKMSSSVWVQTADGMFEKKMIETGIENKKEIEVISGIADGDLVVSSGTYLLNSVFVLKNGANSMGGMKM
ncbi:MAG TPA: efflux RND transporter periplasmic adaptor subunit [Bacteroidia bacterium]|nr:efflux RND transporter periplasmic adaptor subunit [Bacteroidia bacterium]